MENVGYGEGLIALCTNTWAHQVLDRKMRVHELEYLGRTAKSVPLTRISRGYGPSSVQELVDMITNNTNDIINLTRICDA